MLQDEASQDALNTPEKDARGGAPLPGLFQQRYRDAIDELHDLLDKEGALTAEDPEWKAYLQTIPEEDRYVVGAVRRLKFSLKTTLQEGRCKYCWVHSEVCYCADIAEAETPVDFYILYHPNEAFRSSSTGKLVCQSMGGRFLLYGLHQQQLKDLLADDDCYVLFPDDAATTVQEALRVEEDHTDPTDESSQKLESCESGKAKSPVKITRRLKVVVLDGTWSQARMLFSIIHRIKPDIKKIRLDLEAAEQHDSLFNILRKQSEPGRVSTYEACMLLLNEFHVETSSLEKTFKDTMVKLAFEKHRACPFGTVSEERKQASISGTKRRYAACSGVPRMVKTGIKKTTDVELETWILLMKEAATTAPLPNPLIRHCCFCNLYASPSRLLEHVRGRMHVQTVAKAHLGRPPGRQRTMAPRGSQDNARFVTMEKAANLYNDANQRLLGLDQEAPLPDRRSAEALAAAAAASVPPGPAVGEASNGEPSA
ncbi:hypothetical protein DIPPA_00989 [Diplonema papillatum]|nr:hypothetical protein DIPPA_00989 [Diplonema papillatum]